MTEIVENGYNFLTGIYAIELGQLLFNQGSASLVYFETPIDTNCDLGLGIERTIDVAGFAPPETDGELLREDVLRGRNNLFTEESPRYPLDGEWNLIAIAIFPLA